MNKRYLLAAVLVTIGFLLMIGAVGSLECGYIGIGETFARAGAGFAMIAAAAPVSGDLKREKRRNERRKTENENLNSL